MTRRRNADGIGVQWHLPNADGRFAARPFTSTTKASANLISMLAEEGLTWAQIAEAILYDPDAKGVAIGFVEAGHGQTKAAEHVAT